MNAYLGSESIFEPSTLVGLLRWKALHHPDQRIYTFLVDGETEKVHLTYGELDRQAQAIGVLLQNLGATGERALLLYPPGLEYIAGFFGCLYAGVVAVPAYPPDPARLSRTLPRLQAMVVDARATLALTTAPILAMAQLVFEQAPDLGALQWLVTDNLGSGVEGGWQETAMTGDSLAFLQYTSGSTRTPRGVMLSHSNLLHNSRLISHAFGITPESVGVLWLPPYHDMGLIGGILQPVYSGIHCVLMSPLSFLQRPFRWLQAISRYEATISGGPNFAYDLCVRKITPEQRATLDFGRWRVAFNGSEPVRRETMERFVATFEPCGFRPEVFYPCYGLAEATLIVSGGLKDTPPVFHTVQKPALERNQVVEVAEEDESALTLVGCGRSLMDQEIVIVHPESRTETPPDQIGEIWLSGASVAQGYWDRAEETEQTFRARLADTGAGPFLRTGDLGFLKDGELFVTGRLKDLLIIRGRNHYPQDIELTVERSHPAARPGCGAAFSVDVAGEERLVVVQEVYTDRQWDADEVIGAIRQAVAEVHEVQVYTVVLIQPRSIPKTSSGKIQRHACKAGFLAGTLDVVQVSVIDEAVPLRRRDSLTRETLLIKALLTIEPKDRQSLLESHVQDLVSQVLRLDPSQLDPQQPLNTLGLDSIMAVDLMSEIESSLGVTLSVESLFPEVTISQLASQMLARLIAHFPEPSAVPVPAQEAIAEHPLSHGQRALWFLQQMAPDSGAYNLVHAARIRTELDIPAFRRAFQSLVDRHPTLRTTFIVRNGEPLQRVHEHMEVCFQEKDASTWSEAHLNERLAEEVYRPFDLVHGPLMRVVLFTRSVGDYIALMAMHHIVTDLWSLAIIMSELGVLYSAERAGTPASLKPPRAEYTDYVRWQAEMLDSPEGERFWAYWRRQLSGELSVLNLPTDRPRPPIQTYRGATRSLRFDQDLTQKLKLLSKASGTTLFRTLLAAFQVLLHRYTGQEEILVGSPKASRSRNWARVVGYFVNPVVLRANLAGNPPFSIFLNQVRQTVQESFEHGTYPFPLLVERMQPARDFSRSPLFQVMFAWQKTTRMIDSQGMTSFALNETKGLMQLGDLPFEVVALEQRIVPFDLTLLMAEAGDELAASIEYNTDLFDADTIMRMLAHFQILLEGIVADPDQRLSELPLLTEAERSDLLVEWNRTATAPKRHDDIPRLFEAQVAQAPDAVAVVLETEQLTYAELNQRANQLAHYLRRLRVGPEVIVGLLVERSAEAIVGLLGILKAGGAYLPLDPSIPQERLDFVLEDAQVRVLLTQKQLASRLPAFQAEAGREAERKVICLDTDWQAIARESPDNPASQATADNLAYVIYTSGSTGKPKGVLISNETIAHHCQDIQKHFQLNADDRVLQFASFSFDQSLEQILASLITGTALVLRGPEVWPTTEFSRVVSDFGLTVVNLPPAYWHQWVQDWAEAGGEIANEQLRLVISGGDVMQSESLRLWEETPTRSARLLNAYGPTETTITATTFEIPLRFNRGHIPIGRPVANRTIYILDRYTNPVPVGVPGELHIGGRRLARGYLDGPELTAERFMPDPFSNEPGARLYKTGDLARYLPDGDIEFLGRVDYQVKIRGFRVELGEIETVLGRHPGVRDVAVLIQEAKPASADGEVPGWDKRLVAYLVAKQQPAPAASELRDFLRKNLPEYMIPSAFVWLDILPRTPSGKIDRRSLPISDHAGPEREDTYVAPRTLVEKDLAQMWAEVLGLERVGIHENFFDLGGHSLMATQLISRVHTAYQVDLPLRRLFEIPTVAGLAAIVEESLLAQEDEAEMVGLLDELEGLSDEEVRQLLADETPLP